MNVYTVARPLTHDGLDYGIGERVVLNFSDAMFHLAQTNIAMRDDRATDLELAEARHTMLAKQKRCCF